MLQRATAVEPALQLQNKNVLAFGKGFVIIIQKMTTNAHCVLLTTCSHEKRIRNFQKKLQIYALDLKLSRDQSTSYLPMLVYKQYNLSNCSVKNLKYSQNVKNWIFN